MDKHWIYFILFVILGTCKGQFDNFNSIPVFNKDKISATWCTVSPEEFNKCKSLSVAVDREIKQFGSDYVNITCYQAANKEECMTKLDEYTSHLTSLDAGEVFTAGRYHSLVPILQEIHDDNLNYLYSVAVIKKNSSMTQINSIRELRGKKACFAGVGTLAGWIMPVDTLMRSGGMEISDCNNHVKSTINYFGPSCAVNSLKDRYNPLGDNSDKLCKLCIGKEAGTRCTDYDPYAGYGGAFRCLVEAGDVAFLLHTTIQELTSSDFGFENPNSKNDFLLLCLDGSKKPVDDFKTCNWGKVPSNAIVTSSAVDPETREIFQNFLLKAVKIFGIPSVQSQDNYSYDTNYNSNFNSDNFNSYSSASTTQDPLIPRVQSLEVFNLFESTPKYGRYHNLLVSDSARDFVPINQVDQKFTKYLGEAQKAILGIRRCSISYMRLCVVSKPEMDKCSTMKRVMSAQLVRPELLCVKQHSYIGCMQAIETNQADVVVLDASDVYTAGFRHGLIPFMSEMYNLETPEYYAVAVAKEEDPDTDLTYLKNKFTCHTGIFTAAGWVYPMAHLISKQWIRPYGCHSIRAAAEYFQKSCVPGVLNWEYNVEVPPNSLCDLCHGSSLNYCHRDVSEDYYGYSGAFRCLVEGGGDVAFVKHTTVSENTDGKRKEFWARNTLTKDFQLLCLDGTRKSTLEYRTCNLGKIKANAIVARPNNKTEIDAYINFFMYAQQLYGRKDISDFIFSMFLSKPPYNDLIFQDATQQLVIVPENKRTFSKYLGNEFMRARRITDCEALPY